MDNQSELPEEEKFSNDPDENTRIENEFLKMKLMAESGGKFGENKSDLPPEIMNEWLKNIVEFEKNFAHAKDVKLREILNNPDFEDEQLLDDENFSTAWEALNSLLDENNINVDFLRERDDRFKYSFITKELFDHETTFVPASGMSTNFIYEEFHTDHELDIKNRTDDFFSGFFERTLPEFAEHYLEKELILPDGKILQREEMVKRFESMYEAAPEFENTSFEIEKIDFELKNESEDEEEEQTGMGFSEGIVSYDMVFTNGERKKIEGPFKLYLTMSYDWWSIYFFYLAGFNISPQK